MQRYSVIRGRFAREFLLLQGTGCRWKKCTFCDYYDDVCPSPYATNKPVLDMVTGEFGVLDIINSGSALELDPETLAAIQKIVKDKNIHTLWFEMHYKYRHRLEDFAKLFAPAKVKFRCGVETFDPQLRERWHKGIANDVTAQDIAKYFKGICLLCCTDTPGDTRERVLKDIALAEEYFEYYSLNLFCPNSTSLKRNEGMAQWVETELYPSLHQSSKAEVLIDNTDLGVG